jgi:hypothetical protein
LRRGRLGSFDGDSVVLNPPVAQQRRIADRLGLLDLANTLGVRQRKSAALSIERP